MFPLPLALALALAAPPGGGRAAPARGAVALGAAGWSLGPAPMAGEGGLGEGPKRSPRERSDWYLGLGQGFGVLVSGPEDVAPGSFTVVRIGGVVRPRVLVGVQVLAAFDIGRTSRTVLSGTTAGLFEATFFPFPRGGLFVQGGAGAGAFWTQERRGPSEPPVTLGDPTVQRSIAPGGGLTGSVGQEFRLRRSVTLGMNLRYDGMVILDGPRLVNGISVGVALLWY